MVARRSRVRERERERESVNTPRQDREVGREHVDVHWSLAPCTLERQRTFQRCQKLSKKEKLKEQRDPARPCFLIERLAS